MAVSADYVHAFSRDLLMSKDLNPGLRATTAVTSPLVRQGSADPERGGRRAAADVSGLRAVHHRRHAAAERRQDRLRRAAAQRQQALQQQLQRARVLHAGVLARQHRRATACAASGFQVLDDMHLELNEGPTAFDTRHNLVVSGQALVPHTGGLNVELGGARAERLAVQPDQRATSIPIATARRPSRCRRATTPAPAPTRYTVKNYKAERNGAYGPGFFEARRAPRLSVRACRTAARSRRSSTSST